MYDVVTDHQILAFGKHKMQLLDRNSGDVLIKANRDKDTGVWTVHATGAGAPPDVTAPTVAGSPTPRSEVITAMVNLAYAALGPNTNDAIPGDGYSTLVPHGLAEPA